MTTATKARQVKKATGNNRIKKALEATPTIVKVSPLNIGNLTFHLVGTSPLVTHNFDKKSRAEMLETQTTKGKKAQRPPRCPADEFLQAFYWIGGSLPPIPDKIVDQVPVYDEKRVAQHLKKSDFGIPITAFKNALIAACRNTELTMAEMKQTIFTSGTDEPEWAVIKGDPIMDSRICRLPNGTPIERFRPMWKNWETDIRVEWDKNKMSGDQVANLLAIAGYYVGVCEGRPQKSALGWGRWSLA